MVAGASFSRQSHVSEKCLEHTLSNSVAITCQSILSGKPPTIDWRPNQSSMLTNHWTQFVFHRMGRQPTNIPKSPTIKYMVLKTNWIDIDTTIPYLNGEVNVHHTEEPSNPEYNCIIIIMLACVDENKRFGPFSKSGSCI